VFPIGIRGGGVEMTFSGDLTLIRWRANPQHHSLRQNGAREMRWLTKSRCRKTATMFSLSHLERDMKVIGNVSRRGSSVTEKVSSPPMILTTKVALKKITFTVQVFCDGQMELNMSAGFRAENSMGKVRCYFSTVPDTRGIGGMDECMELELS
jgi:hypothetical protein